MKTLQGRSNPARAITENLHDQHHEQQGRTNPVRAVTEHLHDSHHEQPHHNSRSHSHRHSRRNSHQKPFSPEDRLLDRLGLDSWDDKCHSEDLLLKYPVPIPNTTFFRQKKFNRPSSAPGLGRTISLVDAVQRPKATGDLVKRLLAMKASVRERLSKNDKTPLHYAVRTNNLDACQAILDAAMLLQPSTRFKEVLEAQDFFGLTPLIEATSAGHVDLIEELCKRGALVASGSSMGYTALDSAHQGGDIVVIEMLEKYAQVQKDLEYAQKRRAQDQWTPLMQAAFKGDQRSIEKAVSSGSKAWESGLGKETPLHIAARNSNAVAVQALIEKKAFMNTKNSLNMTALSCAIAAGSVPVIKMLVESKAEVRKEDHSLQLCKALKHESLGQEIFDALRPSKKKHGLKEAEAKGFLPKVRFSILSNSDNAMPAQEKNEALKELECFEHFLTNKLRSDDSFVPGRTNKRASVRFHTINATLQKAFKKFDHNKSNALSKVEFIKGMKELGYKGNTQRLFAILDGDRSGSISLDEIVEAAEKLAFADEPEVSQKLKALK